MELNVKAEVHHHSQDMAAHGEMLCLLRCIQRQGEQLAAAIAAMRDISAADQKLLDEIERRYARVAARLSYIDRRTPPR